MSFALLSTFAVLLGILLLAIGLWLAQRLRVQHREVEVLSTLFWQSALCLLYTSPSPRDRG